MARSGNRDLNSIDIKDALTNFKNTNEAVFERIEEIIFDLLEQNNALKSELAEQRAKISDILGSL